MTLNNGVVMPRVGFGTAGLGAATEEATGWALASGYRLLELIENSWGYVVPHCGHWAMMEHPEDFTRATLNFLRAD